VLLRVFAIVCKLFVFNGFENKIKRFIVKNLAVSKIGDTFGDTKNGDTYGDTY